VRRTTAFPRRRFARSLAPVAVLALVSAFAAGCSDDGADSDADDEETVLVDQDGNPIDPDDVEVAPLTAEQIAQAVLQSENMGAGWTEEPWTEDDDTAPGCLADVDVLTEGLQEQDKGGAEFDYPDALTVESAISAFADDFTVSPVFDQVQTALSACTSVQGPDDNGNTWDIALTFSDEAVHDDVDDQYSLSGEGKLTTTNGTVLDIYIEQTAVRVGPNVATVTTSDLQSRVTEHAVWAEIAVERLLEVVGGEEPEATTAPAPA
jgi:hypothetical protein